MMATDRKYAHSTCKSCHKELKVKKSCKTCHGKSVAAIEGC